MKQMLIIISFLLLLTSCSSPAEIESTSPALDTPTETQSINNEHLIYIENMFSGGVTKDGIPSIDDPKYTDPSSADSWLDDQDQVFIYQAKTTTYVYPQKILVWHEIVNDVIDQENILISYCPLTGTSICFTHKEDGTTFGVSGNLINSNLVMYDRTNDDLWPQMLGFNITSKENDLTLNPKPIHWMKWSKAKEIFTDMKVLTTDTGAIRDYEHDPYGNYREANDNNYYVNDQIYFRLMNENNLYPAKTVVIGVLDGSLAYSIKKADLLNKDYIFFANGRLLAIKDPISQLIYVYYNDNYQVKGQLITKGEDTWMANGKPTNDNLPSLRSPLYYDAFWFAWYSYYPETEVVNIND